MNISIKFHITIMVFGTNKTYKLLCEHYYSSDQVERFKVFGKNDRYVAMEKRLNIHKQPWRILEGDIDLANVEMASVAIMNTQDSLNDYLKAKKENNYTNGFIDYKKK
jgi:hypothetical protein